MVGRIKHRPRATWRAARNCATLGTCSYWITAAVPADIAAGAWAARG